MVLKRITKKLKEFREVHHIPKNKYSWFMAVYKTIRLRFKKVIVPPYKCLYCNHYHIGHTSKSKKKIKLKRYTEKYVKLSLLYEGR